MKNLIFVLFLIPLLAFGQSVNQRYISVRGEAKIDVVPDKIELSIVFYENEKIKNGTDLKEKENKLKELLTEYSIDLKNLTVDNFSAKRGNYYSSTSKQIRMDKKFKLQLENIALTDSLILRLFKVGANNVAVTNLFSAHIDEMKLKATTIALSKAQEKAKTMATYLGVSLGDVLEIIEINPSQNQIASRSNRPHSKVVPVANYETGYGDGEMGIRKIRIEYVVDVKYELK